MEKRSRIEERENVRRDTEGGEKVRDTGGVITQPEIKRVSSQTVWQTKPGRRIDINRQRQLSLFCAQGLLWIPRDASKIFALGKKLQASARVLFGSCVIWSDSLPRYDRMRVCPLLVLLCLLCAGRAQKFSALTVG